MKVTLEELKQKPMPKHIAVIMDGNGRWATIKDWRGMPGIVSAYRR